MADVRLLTGASRSGRAEAIDGLLLECWGKAYLIVPTRGGAHRRLREVLVRGDLPGAVGRPVLTFQEFAGLLLEHGRSANAPISGLQQRILLDRAIEQVRNSGVLDALRDAGATEGFAMHMQRLIAQLKQAAIEPEDFNARIARRKGKNSVDTIVASVYKAYQEALQEAGVVDLQGMYWIAYLECRDRKPQVLEGVERLLLDGFDDFTPSEFRLLEALGPHVPEIVFGLNHSNRASQKDLYALTSETARQIQRAFSPVIESLEEEDPRSTAEFVSSSLFWRDEPQRPEALRDDLRLLECHGPAHEMETVARSVKRLVRDEGVKLDEIAVVARDPGAAAALARDVFDECGIPLRSRHERSLADSALGAFVLQFFEALHSWEREAVLDVLCSVWFSPPSGDGQRCRDAFPILARMSGVVTGERDWGYRLDRLKSRIDEDTGEEMQRFLRGLPHAREACIALIDSLHVLQRLGETFSGKATTCQFAEALDRFLDEMRISETVAASPIEEIRATESGALRALRAMLGTLWEWHASDESVHSRDSFRQLIQRAFGLTPVRCDVSPYGVSMLDLEEARHLRFDYVFVVGLCEGEMPRPAPANALYNERDLDALQQLGVKLTGASGHAQKELLLFHRMFSVARKQLTLSWHRITRSGQNTRPGIYLQDVRELLPELKPEWLESELHTLAPPPADAASIRDARNAAFSQVYGVQVTNEGPFRRVCTGAEVERARFDSFPPGPYDGRILNAQMLTALGEEYGAAHEYSVSRLETYASCPFRFFLESVLNIRSVDAPDKTLDPKIRGTLLHDALEAFHRQYQGKALAEIPPEEADETMRAVAADVFKSNARRISSLSKGSAHVEERRLVATLIRYLHIERERGEMNWKPTYLETGFGKVSGRDGHESHGPFVLATDTGDIRFSGRIDRIDTSEDGIRLIDYKSSASILQKDIKDGRSFQLTVYALAAEQHLMKGQICQEAFYLPVGKRKRPMAISRTAKKYDWDERVEIAIQAVTKGVAGIREGLFWPTRGKNKCVYCPAGNVCRYERERMSRKAES